MKSFIKSGLLSSVIVTISLTAHTQTAGPVSTQVLVNVDAKSTAPGSFSAVTVSINDHKGPLTAWEPVLPANAQVVLLIDDGLHESLQREFDSLRSFVRSLPPDVEIMVGFMQSGHIVIDQPFSSDHAAVASALRLPGGLPGMNANPYQCLSDFVKQWPAVGSPSAVKGNGTVRKNRFVLMITNGVDPYSSDGNQYSAHVTASVTDAQRAGVAVYAVHYGLGNGQNYLTQLTQQTGGANLWDGTVNPISIAPFLTQFQHAVATTYIASFVAPVGKDPQKDMLRVKFSAAKTKFHAPEEISAGNQE